ncbi:phosphate-starvation-inducible PsiE family protein [Gluconacetobacter takamatsuzukensis]|uniref:Phosphate-starvation-inducible PsiE family protein n=1 Tax=Gluconacetobacter takamatsuzukensis TaxID=1286190 RepID=A0A7W4KGG3_9PROT|nr:phosphate-starvation-inducible PsiE family protein [Gluconacetobacter takamatsuzukensis]MBB2206459.1 phosphate-starvation-inducible PsiE family protein [Gluconacetobacter takamatsuzukensis]
MEDISMKRSWHGRDWSRLIRLFSGLTFYERFEQAIILILIALIMLVTATATIHLLGAVWHLVVDVGIDPINQNIFQAIFGAIFTVIIALEFKHSLLVVLAQHENVIRVRTIVLIALLAIARKFILLDLHDVTANELFALSAAVLALGIVYWLVREQDARVARDAREQERLEEKAASPRMAGKSST